MVGYPLEFFLIKRFSRIKHVKDGKLRVLRDDVDIMGCGFTGNCKVILSGHHIRLV